MNTTTQILIVGAGIGGLATALALQQRGFAVKVFEAAPEVRAAGAGILIAPNGFRVLQALGLEQAFLQLSRELGALDLTDSAGKPLLRSASHAVLKREFGAVPMGVLRPALYNLLLGALLPDTVQTGKKFLSFAATAETVTAHFADGTSQTGDVLLGADGIHSRVRQQLFPEVLPRYSGQTSYRGVADCPMPEMGSLAIESWGAYNRFGVLAVSQTQTYWFATEPAEAGLKDDSKATAKERLLEYAKTYALPIAEVIAATPETHLLRNDIYDLPALPHWHSGRVGLLGDAAHAPTPNYGQGGNQALEDALVLARSFTQEATHEQVFLEFTRQRKIRAEMVVAQSSQLGQMVHLPHAWQREARNTLLRLIPAWMTLQQNRRLFGKPTAWHNT
jgi:2-polyprenyl-6-methoxyphenol hydroxylase-like FAD-dependent oxidoreductase